MDKSIQKGTLWTIIFFLVSFAKTIILTPLMLVHWGAEGFSFWAIILSARAIILFLSDGFVRYVVNQFNLFFHNNEGKAKSILASGISFLILLSAALCALMVAIFLLQPKMYGLVFGVDVSGSFTGISPHVLGICLISFIVSAALQSVQRMYAGTKEARNLIWHNLLFETLLVVLEITLLAVLLYVNCRFEDVVLADSALIFILAGIYFLYLLQKYPLPGILKKYSVMEGAVQFAKASQLYASNFFEKLTTDGLVLLLAFFRFDKAAIALFATIRTIVNTPLLAQNLLLNTYTPQLQKDFALRDNEGLRKLFTFVRFRIGVVLLAGIVACYPLYEPLFIYWTKGQIVYNKNFMTAMLLMAVFNLYGLSFAFVLKGLNVLPQMLGLMILKTILLGAGLFFAQQNIEFTGWALAATEFIICIILLPILLQRFWQREQFQFSRYESLRSSIPYLLAAVCLFLFNFLSG